MISSNFGFLADHDPKLVQLGAFAELYFRDDPNDEPARALLERIKEERGGRGPSKTFREKNASNLNEDGGRPYMAIRDYCGTSYRGGAVKDGPYRYCTGLCCDRGKVLLGYLEKVPHNRIVGHATVVVTIVASMFINPINLVRSNLFKMGHSVLRSLPRLRSSKAVERLDVLRGRWFVVTPRILDNTVLHCL